MVAGRRLSAPLVCAALTVCGCSTQTRYAQTAAYGPTRATTDGSAPSDAGSLPQPAPPDSGAPACPAALADRLTIRTLTLDANIRYKVVGHDGFPLDERVGFAVSPDDQTAYAAWTDDAAGRIRVTPLDANLGRRAPDVVLQASDLGGISAFADGFAVLVSRADTGEQLTGEDGTVAEAVALLRYRDTTQLWAAPLTGTASITAATYPALRDCAPDFLYGRLAWNGAKFGAYFIVRGCSGDAHAGAYADKFVYADGSGRALRGGWNWGCSMDEGLRMVAEPDVYTTLCMSDSQPYPGLNLFVEGVPPRQLGREVASTDYTAGQFGSVVKLADGSYFVAWLSRDVVDNGTSATAAKQASDIAALRLGPDYSAIAPKRWLLETPTVAETDLHIAPYGSSRLLMVWDSINISQCSATSCFGAYAGTHARLIDRDGNFLSADATISAPPNSNEDLITFANGDVGWAFVPDPNRDYSTPIRNLQGVPAKHQLSIARLRYCE